MPPITCTAVFDNVNSLFSNTLPITTDVVMASGAKLDLGGESQQVASLSGPGGIVTNSGAADVLLTLTTSGVANFSGSIQDGATNVTNLQMAGAGTQILSGANSYTGGTTISSGTLQLGDGTHDATLTTSGILNNSALVYDVAASQAANYPVSGPGSLTKTGAGTLAIGASNGNTGATNVLAGNLQVGQNGVLPAASPVTVANGGKLSVAGNGQVLSSTIMVQPGGMIDGTAATFVLGASQTLTMGRTSSPANDLLGTLSIAGGVLNFNDTPTTVATITGTTATLDLSGGSLNFSLLKAAGVTDTINVASLSLTDPTTLDMNAVSNALPPGTYKLINFSGALTGSTSNLVANLIGVTTVGTRQSFNLEVTGLSNASVALVVTGSAANITWTGATNANWDHATKNWLNAARPTSSSTTTS